MAFRPLARAVFLVLTGLATFGGPSPAALRGERAPVLPLPSPGTGRHADASPTPTPDRLAPPLMPENPTLADTGHEIYYHHCSPCHGDRGQGLTDEWRAVWVDDHQNCWARGCHGGRVEDQGFPIPTTVPAVVGHPAALSGLGSLASLTQYLATTHPPQNPGILEPDQYRALAFFLLTENGLALEPGQDPAEPGTPAVDPALMVLTMAVLFGAACAAQTAVARRALR